MFVRWNGIWLSKEFSSARYVSAPRAKKSPRTKNQVSAVGRVVGSVVGHPSKNKVYTYVHIYELSRGIGAAANQTTRPPSIPPHLPSIPNTPCITESPHHPIPRQPCPTGSHMYCVGVLVCTGEVMPKASPAMTIAVTPSLVTRGTSSASSSYHTNQE